MKYPDIKSFGPDPSYFEKIHPNVWLMDDHRWAYFIWEQLLNRERSKAKRALLHLDYHWDGINDFKADSNQERLRKITDIEEIFQEVREGKRVRKDSFIAPAIIRGIINEVHFLCFQDDTPPGLDEELIDKFNVRQFFYEDISSLLISAPNSSLFNIDLDIFDRSDQMYEGELWPDFEILEFLDGCSELIKSSPLITIAMSFGYSGSREHTKHLARLVLPKVLEFRAKSL